MSMTSHKEQTMEKKTLTLQNKETYAYLEFNPGAEKTVVLLHGNMSSSVHFEPLIERLSDDYRIVAPDFRGFGDSSYHQPIESLEDLADDLMDFLHQLSIDKAHIIGWSTGGGIGLKFAAKYQQATDKVVLIESASYRGYPIYRKDANFQPTDELYASKEAMAQDPVQVVPALQAIEQDNRPLMKQIWEAAIYNEGKPEEAAFDRYIRETMKQRNLVDIDWSLMTFNMSHTPNGVAPGDGSIEDVTAPVLSIYGKKDRVITETMFKETVEALKDAETEIYEDGSHSPITDFPDRLSRRILRFLNPS